MLKQIMSFTVLSAVSRQICDKQPSASNSKSSKLKTILRLRHVNGKFKIQRLGRQQTFFPQLLRDQNMVRVIEGKIM